MKYLNIGCGSSFHKDWFNIDIVAVSPQVTAHDIINGLPYPDGYFDAVYASHLLEHLRKYDASRLLKEIFRVLTSGGILRLVVPDLEKIVRTYLNKLDGLVNGDKALEADYDWIMLELLDQVARDRPGGEMLEFLMNKEIKNKNFIYSRIGTEADKNWNKITTHTIKAKIKNGRFWTISAIRIAIARRLVKWFAGKNALKSFDEGVFRNSGEIHQWMYDRFSLKRLMEQAEFEDIIICRANESQIADFNSFELDIINDQMRKPDSLFMEGIKN